MLHTIEHIVEHTLVDSAKLLPFLFLTYLVMEFLEHKTGSKIQKTVQKAGKFGPVIGSILGAFPQCGFSAAASNLYAGRIITLGTLISIYLSTSDEMLPILISASVDISLISQILGVKILIGMIAGILIDFVMRKTKKEEICIHDLCEHDHCHCEKGIFRSALVHTLQIFAFILIVTLLLNGVIEFIGEDSLSGFIMNRPFVGSILAGIVGLIPNCASSVVITQLYLEGAMSYASMMSGLLVGAGVGILVLFKVNQSKKESLKIIGLLYLIGVAAGCILEVMGMLL